MTGPVLMGLVVAAAAAGGAAGYGLRASEHDRIIDALAAQSAELQALRQALPANPPDTLRRDEIVALVQAGATRPPASAATVAPVMTSPPPAAEPATVESARRVVDDAVAEGRWTNRRREDLRGLLRRADAQTRDEALRYLSIAANRDALTLETDGPPL